MDFQQRFGQEGSLEDFRIHPARTLGGFPPNTSLEIQPFSPESQPSDDSHGSKLAISMVGNSSMAAMFHGCVHQHGEGKMELKPRDLTKVPAQVNVLALSFYSHLLGNHVVPSSSRCDVRTHYTSLWISWCHETCSHRHISSYLRNHYWKLPEVMNWWFHQAKG